MLRTTRWSNESLPTKWRNKMIPISFWRKKHTVSPKGQRKWWKSNRQKNVCIRTKLNTVQWTEWCQTTLSVDKMTFYLKLQISLAETIINYPFHQPVWVPKRTLNFESASETEYSLYFQLPDQNTPQHLTDDSELVGMYFLSPPTLVVCSRNDCELYPAFLCSKYNQVLLLVSSLQIVYDLRIKAVCTK